MDVQSFPAGGRGLSQPMTAAQRAVQSLLDDLVARDVERGLQVAAYHQGKLVVDAWAGLADAATGRAVDGETLFCVFSCTKGVTATAIHRLAERGLIAYDVPVVAYWPEFGCRGKGRITIGQVLSHTAGVPYVPEGVTVEEMCDWERMCARIADLAPVWEPGTHTAYHALTFGWILGEVARRASGRPLAQLVQEEIADPLGAELYLGIPDAGQAPQMAAPSVAARVATLEGGAAPTGVPEDSPLWRRMPRCIYPLGAVHNRPDVRRACLPHVGLITNARSLARHYAALIGTLPGEPLLPPERLRVATALQTEQPDAISGSITRRSLGYILPGTSGVGAMGSGAKAFGHPGAGGAWGSADPQQGLAFALTKTRLTDAGDPWRVADLVAQALREALATSPAAVSPESP